MIFIVIGAGMAIAMYLLSKILSPSSPDTEKLSAYECGFEAFDDARSKFDVKFYLVSILSVSYTHLRAHETESNIVCRLRL